MRVPISWLRDFVDLPRDGKAIAERLAMLGFPVAETVTRPRISGVVVGRVVALGKHPDADRLQVATIDIGAERTLTIATAATNVAVGNVIPVATVGAQLPHLKIEPRKMRGIASEGMMCSADELGLPSEWFEDGIMQLGGDVPLGIDVVELFGLTDDILEVEVTSNRVDAMSVIGLARELAASYDITLSLPSFENPGVDLEPAPATRVTIDSPDCTCFIAQFFDGVEAGVAPPWMRVRLALAGQRPINNLVDISNYVMLETAQPLHLYDASRIAGRHLVVRDARAGERLVTLDGVERELQPQALVVADSSGPLGLAGLMGGQAGEVRPDTTAIILESANFAGARIRRMSMQLGFRSEASSRHEKLLAPALADIGAARAAQLLAAGGARAYRPQLFGETPAPATPIALRPRDVERTLGIVLDAAKIDAHLTALGCTVMHEGNDRLAVTPPPWRRDLTITVDLIEEIARMEGYDSIEPVMPSVPPHEVSSTQFDLEDRLADIMVALGYREILTHSLHGGDVFDRASAAGIKVSHVPIEIRNPLSEDQRYLRYTLAPGMMKYFARADRPERAFEIGHIFMQDGGSVSEMPTLLFGFSADPVDEPSWRDTNFSRLKGDCIALLRRLTGYTAEPERDVRTGLHPGKTAILLIEGREIASIGRIGPRLQKAFDIRLPVYFCNIYLDKLPDYRAPVYRVPSRFPSTYRDLALIVDLDVSAAQLEEVVATAVGPLCKSVAVFDEYRGPKLGDAKKSLAVRATIGFDDRTITDEEADAAIERALESLSQRLGATMRV